MRKINLSLGAYDLGQRPALVGLRISQNGNARCLRVWFGAPIGIDPSGGCWPIVPGHERPLPRSSLSTRSGRSRRLKQFVGAYRHNGGSASSVGQSACAPDALVELSRCCRTLVSQRPEANDLRIGDATRIDSCLSGIPDAPSDRRISTAGDRTAPGGVPGRLPEDQVRPVGRRR